MAIKFEGCAVTPNTEFDIWGGATGQRRAQTFTTIKDHTISSVKLRLYRYGSCFGVSLTVAIKNVDSNGHPTTTLTSASLDVSSITSDTNGTWYSITFTQPATLTNKTKYCIYCEANGDTDNRVYWKANNTNPYADGEHHYTSEGSWITDSATDFLFETYGVLTVSTDIALSHSSFTVFIQDATAENRVLEWNETNSMTFPVKNIPNNPYSVIDEKQYSSNPKLLELKCRLNNEQKENLWNLIFYQDETYYPSLYVGSIKICDVWIKSYDLEWAGHECWNAPWLVTLRLMKVA